MKLSLLISFRFFLIEENAKFDVSVITISENYNLLDSFFTKEGLTKMGLNRAASSFTHGVAFGYKFNFELANNSNGLTDDIQELVIFSGIQARSMNTYMLFLWFVKDCSAHVNEIMIDILGTDQSMTIPNYEPYTNAKGNSEFSSFSIEELQKAYTMARKYEEIIGKSAELRISDYPVGDLYTLPSVMNQRSYNEKTRIERAIIFLNYARTESFVAMKIALYVPIFECFFSSENTEISHKVSERCAHYLGSTKQEKLDIYDSVKSAYDIRSKLLHGDKLTEGTKKYHKLENQIEISIKTDSLIRRLLTKVIMEDSEIFIQNDLHLFYKDLIF